MEQFYKLVNENYTQQLQSTNGQPPINDQVEALNNAFRQAASYKISKQTITNRQFEMSDNTKNLLERRQVARDRYKWTEAKELTKQIRKSVRNDKTEGLLKNLEECLWEDIKKLKKGQSTGT